ncbi:hypothetical protein A3H19_00495 [Candidatus Woesebacteria bacterium RIFCSPLOWO2_12_FULL_39_9]|nr:MAG: hypothetical protein A3H19_00495 [Candidatus Woesebacteria bacterium RIFCSPLOWO2_12_FULL_39_9]
MIFVDTNFFIRFLLADISLQYKKAKQLFNLGAEGKLELFTSTVVIFEIYWVMLKFYGKTKPETVKILKKVLSLKFVYLAEREILQDALEIYEKTALELEDYYNVIYANSNNVKEFKTFDRKLQRYLE